MSQASPPPSPTELLEQRIRALEARLGRVEERSETARRIASDTAASTGDTAQAIHRVISEGAQRQAAAFSRLDIRMGELTHSLTELAQGLEHQGQRDTIGFDGVGRQIAAINSIVAQLDSLEAREQHALRKTELWAKVVAVMTPLLALIGSAIGWFLTHEH